MKSLFTWHTDTILIADPDQVLRQLEYGALSAKYLIIKISSRLRKIQASGLNPLSWKSFCG